MKPAHSFSVLVLALHCTAALIFALFLGISAGAQIDRAELEGTVTDSSGAVVAGASVKVVAVATGLSSAQPTNTVGYYRIPGLAVGRYTATVSSAGFKTTVIQNVVLEVGQTRTLDIKLLVGAATEKVEVNAPSAPSDRTSAEAGTVIRPDQIADLANNGRDWTTLSLLAPFAQDDGGGDQRTIRFAGRARDDNNFQIDGVDAGGIQEQAQKSTTRLQISEDAIEVFQAPPVDANGNFTRFGNETNGMIRALDSWQIDLALNKETKLTERVAMEFAVQAFNIFNHVQLGDPSTLKLPYSPGSPGNLAPPGDFGVINTTVNFNNNNDDAASPNTGTGLPRQLQFMVRFVF